MAARTGTLTAPPAPPALDQLLTTEQLMERSTLSRSTLWRLSRTDAILRRAFVQLTPTRIGWRAPVVAEWLDARSGRAPLEAA